MKGLSLISYFLIVLLNGFVFISIVFYPLIMIALHLLMFWVTFNSLLGYKWFNSTWNTTLFVLIPFIIQLAFLICASPEIFSYGGLLILYISAALLELVLLTRIYAKAQKKKGLL